MDEMLCFN